MTRKKSEFAVLNGAIKSLVLVGLFATSSDCHAQPLPGTAPLEMEGDLASNIVAGADRFLLRKIDESQAQRGQYWHRDFSSPWAYDASISTNRERLAHILGVRDERPKRVEMELITTVTQRGHLARGQGYEVFAVRWPAFGDVSGEGLLLSPTGRTPVANVVAHTGCQPDSGATRWFGRWDSAGIAIRPAACRERLSSSYSHIDQPSSR